MHLSSSLLILSLVISHIYAQSTTTNTTTTTTSTASKRYSLTFKNHTSYFDYRAFLDSSLVYALYWSNATFDFGVEVLSTNFEWIGIGFGANKMLNVSDIFVAYSWLGKPRLGKFNATEKSTDGVKLLSQVANGRVIYDAQSVRFTFTNPNIGSPSNVRLIYATGPKPIFEDQLTIHSDYGSARANLLTGSFYSWKSLEVGPWGFLLVYF